MNSIDEILIGVDIGSRNIKTYVFNPKNSTVDYLLNLSIDHHPITPGHLTVILSEMINPIAQKIPNTFIIIAIPGRIARNHRRVESLQGWPGWFDVPLADWLEVRTKSKVMIIKKKSFSLLNNASSFFYKIYKKYSNLCEKSICIENF